MDVRKEDINEDTPSRGRSRRRRDDGAGGDGGVMDNCCGEGRVWIFLVLGILALVFSVVLTGVYMNVRTLTTSMDSVEVMPSFVPIAASGLTGLLVLLQFWKRYKVLVYSVLVLSAITVVLCVVAAVLTGTHILQPLLSVTGCVYSRRDKMCRCVTQFRRDRLELERVADGEQVYLVMQEVSSCGDIENVLPGMLFTMIGLYGVVSLVCVVAGVISFLVYQTELRRKYLEETEDDTYSPPSSPSSSENYAEHHTMLPSHLTPTSNSSTLVNIYTNPSTTANEDDSNTNDDGNTTPSDLIYSPTDVPMGYAEACRMRRCQSFSQPRQGMLREGSPGSSTSSQTASLTGADRNMGGAEGGPGKLKEHRKKGRRAVTLHGLDREQLLLILSLQMRYLQESDQSTKREGAINNFNYLNNNSVTGGPSNGRGQDNIDPSLFNDQQRRALTPTPRQERLSSSRTTDDDLDYRPAKLARSHTPQPYHFKNPSQYSQNVNNQPPLQSYQFQTYQQHKQQLQLQQSQVAVQKEEEPPTLITYDLRNITKTGPIVYENVPSVASSVSCYNPEGHSSNNSQMLQKITSRVPQAGQLQPQPAHQSSDPVNQVLILGGNIQGAGNPWNQFSRQTSQASTSSQPSIENSPSDTRKLVPSKDKALESATLKTKSKKKLSKKEKNLKKDDEMTQVSSGQSNGLTRTDSNASKGGIVADRWQTLMEDGPKQAQTLWENVQRKIVSDPQTPDSTLDLHHPSLSEHQSHVATLAINSFACSQITPRLDSFQSATSQKQPHVSSSLIVPTSILKNSNAVTNYSSETNLPIQNMFQNLPSPLNPNQNMHYPNPNPVHTNTHSFQYHNAFIPVANSSIENYEDINEVFPGGQEQHFIPSSVQPPDDLYAISSPPKPPRILGKPMTKFGTTPSTVQPVPDTLVQKLRPKSYMNAVDRESKKRNSFVDSNPISIRGAGQRADMGQHQLLMEGSAQDDSSHFQTENGYGYSQPYVKFNHNSEAISTSPEYNRGHIYHNTFPHPDEQGQYTKKQHHVHNNNNNHPSQWSAFQSFSFNHNQGPSVYEYPVDHKQGPSVYEYPVDHNQGPSVYEYPVAGREICDTDLDDLPRPQHQRQHISGQLCSPQLYAAPPYVRHRDLWADFPLQDLDPVLHVNLTIHPVHHRNGQRLQLLTDNEFIQILEVKVIMGIKFI